jgi:hypothetical protein
MKIIESPTRLCPSVADTDPYVFAPHGSSIRLITTLYLRGIPIHLRKKNFESYSEFHNDL